MKVIDVTWDRDVAKRFSNVLRSQHKHNIAIAIWLNDSTDVSLYMLAVRMLGIPNARTEYVA